jgi:hypothetical protein
MWFKNLQLYRLPKNWAAEAAPLEEQLARLTLQGCSATDPRSIGWVAPRDGGSLIHSVNQQWLLALGVEEKLLPASIVKRFASDRAKEIEEAEGRRIGRREMRELVEAMTVELLPRAFIRRRSTYGWIDRSNGWLVVDAASPAKAEEFLEHLRKSIDTLPAKVLKVTAVALGGDDRLGRRRRGTSRLHPRPGPRTALDGKGDRSLREPFARRRGDPPAHRCRQDRHPPRNDLERPDFLRSSTICCRSSASPSSTSSRNRPKARARTKMSALTSTSH